MIGAGWRGTFSALCAILIGIGLARFAYTPLIPALVQEQWFTPANAAYLGAANLAGYLAGALLARRAAGAISEPVLIRAAMLAAAASFFACAHPLSFAWFFAWRFIAGLAGAILMVLAAPTVLPHVPSHRRGLAGGVIFTAVGLGIVLSGTLIPLILRLGLSATWIMLGALSLMLTAVAWNGWPRAAPTIQAAKRQGLRHPDRRLMALYLEYGLDAAGSVPHMVFLVDFIARGLGRGLAVGSWYWVLLGAGAVAGPVLAGNLGDRIGFGPALRLAFLAKALSIGWLAVSDGPVALVVSSLVVGALLPGNVALVLGRVRELARDEREAHAAWSLVTLAYAVGQAVGAYGLSFLFDRTGSYGPLFETAAAALALALLLDFAVGWLSPAPGKGQTR